MSNIRIGKGVIRRSFGKIKDIVPVPNLIEVQSSSFNDFVQFDYLPKEREVIGLEKVLRDVFPIEYENQLSLEYVSYELGNWACTCGKLSGIEARYSWHCSSCKKSGCSRLNSNYDCPACKKKQTAKYKTCDNCLARVVIQLPMTLEECRANEQTFSLPLKVKMQLVSWSIDESGNRSVHDIKEQNIFFTDLPVMADLYEEGRRFKLGNLGTFLINGVDRVIVSQLHRSPGAVFSQSKKLKDYQGRPYYLARLIPMRGSWLDFEFDSSDLLYVRIDKKKKILVTTFLQALGYPRDQILSLFYPFERFVFDKGALTRAIDDTLIGHRFEKGALSGEDELAVGNQKITKELLVRLKKSGFKRLALRPEFIVGRVVAEDVVDPATGEILLSQGATIAQDDIQTFKRCKQLEFALIQLRGYTFQPTIPLTLSQDRCMTFEEAIKDVHSKIWPGDSSSLKEVKERLEAQLFNPRFYDLTRVGRIRINRKLRLDVPEDVVALTKEDIIATIQYLLDLRERGEGELDDIDHLGNRRVRLVGELLNNQMYVGFTRIERIVRERFRLQEPSTSLMPQDFLNVKPLSAVMREFFGLGQLSQFMDQTNPLAEIAHKRRLSALGPGGVMKDRATFEVRDVHNSHYGRICPIETPEGQTVGLISSLATYATVNDLGFIESAYRPVDDRKIKNEIVFLDAFEESDKFIAQAEVAEDKNKIGSGNVLVRHEDNFVYVDAKKVDYIDLSPKQLVSVSSALIPFLEHDDAVRALMGANMQRQAVPLISPEVPLVGTGMEQEIAKASGSVLMAKRAGKVIYVSSEKIVIEVKREEFVNEEEWVVNGIDTYQLKKFRRSSHDTWIHHTPIVKEGDMVEKDDILTDGASISDGELALGSNLLVAFMPWLGYNFEDAIVLSKSLVAQDSLTSVHVDEYVVDARDTKLGPEEITRDIPNVSEAALESLDEDGIVRIGTRVKPGDILVGKVTLKGDIQYSPEEKLLRAIFGEKSREVRDTSLRVPPGVEGTVVDIKMFSRGGVRKDKRYKEDVTRQVEKLEQESVHHVSLLEKMVAQRIISLVAGKEASAKTSKSLIKNGMFNKKQLEGQELEVLLGLKPQSKALLDRVKELRNSYENQLRILEGLKEERVSKMKKGDPLPSGVIKMIKVYLAMKRPISAGDKIAGRHGNKGVVSTIVPREDMPYLDDGTPVDIVLNPLGVPSRMNVGQILETALGLVGRTIGEDAKKALKDASASQIKKLLVHWYGKEMVDEYAQDYGAEALQVLAHKTAQSGLHFKTPVFDGANYESDIRPMLSELSLPDAGAFRIRDGRTGEYFEQPVTVGSIYMMKLHHMVEDKLHARSVGPYSLVTQQPLGGKAQQGGQRLGEMEVWALEAYGAAYTLQEMLTYKSDDVSGRHKAYSAIVRGEDVPDPGIPESFNVLIKELQSLGLQVDLLKTAKENVSE